VSGVAIRQATAGDAGFLLDMLVEAPEITMAVVASQRGRGIGRRLLEALVAAGREQGWPAVSDTMLRDLRAW
jgi:GNAT superfamily N-acetyltransferase